MITVSVVSHAQNALVNRLLEDLDRHCHDSLEVILTLNAPDPEPLAESKAVHRGCLIVNQRPRGFGANHNTAFRRSRGETFFVVNPDIRLQHDPFPSLYRRLREHRVAAAGPRVHDAQGRVEDSARRFPTFASLVGKFLHGRGGPDYPVNGGAVEVDWLGGMFLGFRRDAFERVGGFDERYFLYYEDVDICRRLRSRGYSVLYDTSVSVVHEARRASHRDLRLMRIHAASVLRYLLTRYKSGP